MKHTQHTPGPWHRNIKPASKYNTVFAGRNTHIARIVPDGLSETEIEANCSLIAAAPDLLAALSGILELACIDQDDGNLALEALATIRLEARAAIAKAEGKV